MRNKKIQDLIEQMSTEQKIGSLLTLGFSGTVPGPDVYRFINEYHCGGLRLSPDSRVFGSYVDPNSKKTVVKLADNSGVKYNAGAPRATAAEYKQVLDHLQAAAAARPLSIPLHFSYDQEGGSSADFFFGGVNIFPKPMAIRAAGDEKWAYKAAWAAAKQGKALGFSWMHSPVLDINTQADNPEIGTRSYSDDAEVVYKYAAEACKGFKDAGMIATGKHFPGRGSASTDSHFTVPVLDVPADVMWERELLPYRRLIERDLLPSIMIAHTVYPAYDQENIATCSRNILTGLLREKLGFEGVITTDSMTMAGVAGKYGVAQACALALEAGADLVLMKAQNHLVEDTFSAIRDFVENGRISINDLDQKVYRVLNLKDEYGLFNEPSNVNPEDVLNDPEIKSAAREIARRSVQVMRDYDQLLPLNNDTKALVIEQKVKNYNSFNWHSGILYEACARIAPDTHYLETDFTYDAFDKERILQAIQADDVDEVIISSYFLRGKKCNKEFLEKLIDDCSKKIIIVSNTPYEEISIPGNAGTVVLSLSTAPESVKATADLLYGKLEIKGEWPLEHS